jgi:HSP20 family protein
MRRPDDSAMRSAVDIKVDVIETNQAYTIKAEIPGARKEGARVQIEGKNVSISAVVKDEKETRDKNERILTRERDRGRMARGFTLTREINDKESQAAFKDGVLTLTLPKQAQAKGSVLHTS